MRNPLLEKICNNLLNLQGFSLKNCDDACRIEAGAIILKIESTTPNTCPECNKSVPIYDYRKIMIREIRTISGKLV